MVVPNGVAAVITFFLFVAPGLTWELLHEQKYPAVATSAFREAARVALLSTVFSGASIGLLVLARLAKPNWLPDVEDWLKPHSSYARIHYRTVSAAAAVEVLLACLLAVVFHVWATRGQPRRMHAQSLRNVVLRADVPPGPVIRTAAIRMKDGTAFMGTIALVGHEESRDDAEIALAPPINRAPPGGTFALLEDDWQRVVLPFAEIDEMWLSWRPDTNGSRERGRRRRKSKREPSTAASA